MGAYGLGLRALVNILVQHNQLLTGLAPPGRSNIAPLHQVQRAARQGTSLARPGCTAADESGVVLYHLQGLAEGKKGFGVLALDVERLERAAQGAHGMGDASTAAQLRSFKEVLPTVRDQEAAARAVAELKPAVDAAWELGRRCGGHDITPVLRQRASELAARVGKGEITREQAVQELQRGMP